MPIVTDPAARDAANTVWHDWAPFALVVLLHLLAGAHLAAKKARHMTDEQKLALLRRMPRLVAFLDLLIAFKIDGELFNSGLRRIAQGKRAPSVVAMLDAFDKEAAPDPEVSRAMKSLPPMPLLSLPPPSTAAQGLAQPVLPLASLGNVRNPYGAIGPRDLSAPEEPKEKKT